MILWKPWIMSVNKTKTEWRQASNLAKDRTQNYVTIGICLRSTFVNIFSNNDISTSKVIYCLLNEYH